MFGAHQHSYTMLFLLVVLVRVVKQYSIYWGQKYYNMYCIIANEYIDIDRFIGSILYLFGCAPNNMAIILY